MNVREHYFEWLCQTILAESDEKSYLKLARCLFNRIFVPIVDHDENRAYDGIELRDEFLREEEYPKYTDIPGECSVLEMMIALARRMDFETSDPYEYVLSDRTAYWFWEMIDNLGLSPFDDECYDELNGEDDYVDSVIDAFVDRRYTKTGVGGLFPLRRPSEDQRRVELWYQMSAYLMENDAC